MNKYSCRGFRSVRADEMFIAAYLFAGRAARRKFGRAGYARSLKPTAWALDGHIAQFTAFIGNDLAQSKTRHDIHFIVSRC